MSRRIHRSRYVKYYGRNCVYRQVCKKGDQKRLKTAEAILAAICGGKTSNTAYGAREYVLREFSVTWMSRVWDAVRREVDQKWKAPDPKLNAKRNFLIMQGRRGIAQFMCVGISIPAVYLKTNTRSIVTKWDTEIGEIEFVFPKMDASRWFIWRNIEQKTNGWSLGTVQINERDGFLYVQISYARPDFEKALDENKTMLIEFSESQENFITAHSPDDAFSGDVVNVTGAIAWLKEMECIYNRYKERFRSYWNPTGRRGQRTKGYKAVSKRMANYRTRRENGEKDHNHLWTRRIVEHAKRNQAGNIIVIGLPEKEMFGLPWGWYQFKQFLTYKVQEIGGKISFIDLEKAKAA